MFEDYNGPDAEQNETAQGVCAGILSFIDSLPDEPVLSAASDLVSAGERYVQPKPGDEHCLRSELLNTKDNLKALLK